MARRYGAFLVRCWHLDGGAERVEVAHIQSGERAVVTSLAAALAWIAARAGDAVAPRPALSEPAGGAPGTPDGEPDR